MKKVSYLAIWRETIVRFASEIGYVQLERGLGKDDIMVVLDTNIRQLKIEVILSDSSLNYDIKSAQSCIDFCLLLRSIESVK
ncbi:hypothetical protein [Vibrio sp. AND4]|uniref:hypothetical protein n=1 Tax=Vibrio sp. AND4 TaxID=314289 RepID=UPI00015EFB0D|nr:hypothetical protein [Vibrio sp. AND4]EDP60137.1 hypothetical protein AND4_01973 [Vibrio sp. AND4]